MALITPARMTPHLRLTPTPSRPQVAKSPTKQSRDEQCLLLKQVIGTTTASNNAFDSCQASKSFAFAAGGAAIIATLDDSLNITQRFYRAKPSTGSINVSTPIYDSPTPLSTSYSPKRQRDGSIGPGALGSSVSELSESPTFRVTTARERTKAATCVALSPNGKLIAVGETGHRPRVLIFSTAKDASPDMPLTALSEHTFGVKCVAFSPDNQYLASLGDANDGFLYIWNINQRSGSAFLHANNKCTSNVRQLAWMGTRVVTVGTRHVKVWRIETASKSSSSNKRFSDLTSLFSSPSRALAGRNCLLGDHLDNVYTCVVPISTNKAIVCSEQGGIYLVKDVDSAPQFCKIVEAGFNITCSTVHLKKHLVVGGAAGEIKVFSLEALFPTKRQSGQGVMSDEGNSFRSIDGSPDAVAMVSLNGRVLSLDSQRGLQILDLNFDKDASLSGCSVTHRYPAHGGAVIGLQSFGHLEANQTKFLTYSADGMILFWDENGVGVKDIKVPLDLMELGQDGAMNELKTVKASAALDFLVSGDKAGLLKIIDVKSSKINFQVRAHANEITSVDIHETAQRTLIASASRDRLVQIFKHSGDSTEHIQTLDEHIGAVTGICFSSDGRRLVSCSSDRTVVVRDRIQGWIDEKETTAYLVARTITLKAAPVCISLTAGCPDSLLVSTIDRTLTTFDLRSGNLATSFKAGDGEGGDAVIVGSAVQVELSPDCWGVAGLSGTDKSIRIYDHAGRLVGREYGHTEGMSGIALMKDTEGRTLVVTAATDGTVFVWKLTYGVDVLQAALDKFSMSEGATSAASSSPVLRARPPLRKVLSSSEILQLQESTSRAADTSMALRRARSRSPKRKASRMSLATRTVPQDISASLPARAKPEGQVSAGSMSASKASETSTTRRVGKTQGGSPEMPRYQSQTLRGPPRPASMGVGAPKLQQRKSMTSLRATAEVGSLAAATEQICKSLHAYRKKLATSSDVLPLENVRELERELSTTAKALADKAARNETVMVKLLDQYSERLMGMLDEKISLTVEQQFRRSRQQSAPEVALEEGDEEEESGSDSNG